ncbi:pilus assembly protein PilM [Tersicoccus sp. MR15.9]|uniref:pilus assembly protein PilM n=1 Tax=Tersicoccus mangrovi TaxID=3121635 RepID=UPI002FE6C166
MADTVLGIDFGSSGLKLAVARVHKGATTITDQVFIPLDPGLIVKGAPTAEAVPDVAAALKAALAERKITARDAIVGLGSVNDVFVDRSTTPYHPPKDYLRAVSFDIAADTSLLLGAPDGVLLDAVVFEDFLDPDGARKVDALLCGTRPELVDRLAAIATKAGLRVIGADVSGLAVLRALPLVPRPVDHLDVIVDVGQDVLTVLIHENGRPYSISLAEDAGGARADQQIGRAIGNEHQDAITRAKTVIGRDKRVRDAIQDYAYLTADKVRAAIQAYLDRRRVPVQIAGLTLLGGGALLPGLRDAIETVLQVPTIIASDFDPGIDGSPRRYEDVSNLSADFTVAVGLTMGAAA